MNRADYWNYIQQRLALLAISIDLRGKSNILDLHVLSENFYLHFLNELFGWQLKNKNATEPNADAIDLIDSKNKIVIQVSATASKQKVESALSKNFSSYDGYTFKFVSISKDASSLRKIIFSPPRGLTFNPTTDIFDIPSILAFIG